MAITLANSNTKSEAAVTSTTITFTASTNDVVLVGIMSSVKSDQTFSEGGGTWTKIAELYSNDSEDTNLAVFKKRMGASPDASVTLTISGVAVTLLTIAGVFAGVDTTTEEDATATTATGINGGTPDPASITTVTNNAWVVVFAASTQADVVTNPSTGYSNLLQIGTGGPGTRTLVFETKAVATAGAEDPAAITDLAGDANQSWSAITVALRPAAGSSASTGRGLTDSVLLSRRSLAA